MANAQSVSSSAKRKAILKAIIAGTVVMLLFPIGAANAQGELNYKWEAGFQVTTIQFGAPAEKPFGLGGRIGRELGNHQRHDHRFCVAVAPPTSPSSSAPKPSTSSPSLPLRP